MNQAVTLPNGFVTLEKFVKKWARPTFSERYEARLSSSMSEIELFYNVMMGSMERIAEHLSEIPIDNVPESSKRLLYLAYSAMNISPAVELYQQPEVWLGFEAKRLELIDYIGIDAGDRTEYVT